MPVKQHVQETGGQEGGLREDEGGGWSPLLSLWLCCAGAKGPGTPEIGPPLSGHPREWMWSSFLFSMALGSRHEHSSRMSHDMGKGIT